MLHNLNKKLGGKLTKMQWTGIGHSTCLNIKWKVVKIQNACGCQLGWFKSCNHAIMGQIGVLSPKGSILTNSAKNKKIILTFTTTR